MIIKCMKVQTKWFTRGSAQASVNRSQKNVYYKLKEEGFKVAKIRTETRKIKSILVQGMNIQFQCLILHPLITASKFRGL